MNLFEKIRFNIIQRLIDKKSFESAIKNIDRLIPHTTRLRKCINLKIKCLIEQNKYQEASDLCQYLFPYAVKDIDDIDTLSHLSKIYYHLGNQIQTNKYLNSYKILTITQEKRKLFLDQYNKKSYNIYNYFISTNNISEVLDNIIDDNLQMLRITEASVYFSLEKRLGINISNNIINEFMKYEQAVNFSNELNVNQNNVYCVISESADEDELLRDRCLVKALSVLGKKVYHIIPYQESDKVDFSINEYLKMSESEENIYRISTRKIDEKYDVEKISDIIKDLNNSNNINEPIILFVNSELLMEINEDVEMSKILEMYYRHYEEIPIPRKDCLLLGSYWKSISYLWGYDVKKEFEKEPIYDFSIIIPVRNSIKYLRETIETCLNQDYSGTYEILISDNSCGKINVLDIVNSLNNKRIRYIRTPYDLSLTKSFEFAYLNSHGKYILSIGADDAITENGLKVINNAIIKYPNNNIIMWPRASYRWPQWKGAEKNVLVYENEIPNHFVVKEKITKPLIRDCLIGDLLTTGIPALYLVTCAKKEYIKKIIKVTGKFEDGLSQDGYTGVLNIFLEKKIVFIDYPVIVAGNSEIGVGAVCEQQIKTIKTFYMLFKLRYVNYRYNNYYDQYYRNTLSILSMGTTSLLLREYMLVKRHNLDEIELSNKDKLIILSKIYSWFLKKRPLDVNMYINILNKLAISFGNNIYLKHIYERKKIKLLWNIRSVVSNIFRKRLVRNISIKLVLFITEYFQKTKIINYLESLRIVSSSKSTIYIDLNKRNEKGIKCAVDNLYQYFNNMSYFD